MLLSSVCPYFVGTGMTVRCKKHEIEETGQGQGIGKASKEMKGAEGDLK